MMANDQLIRYRQGVDDGESGNALEAIVADLRGQTLVIEGHGLKTAPRNYPRDHPHVELLRHKSVAAMRTFPPAACWGRLRRRIGSCMCGGRPAR